MINILPYATQDYQKFYDERTSSFREYIENIAYVKDVNDNEKLYYTFMKSTYVRDSTYNPNDLRNTTLDENGLPNPKPTCNPESPSGIVNEWWYQYYFDVPPCAYGRFLQSTGTCWMNAILNTIILTPKMAEIAVKNFYDDTMLIQEARQYIIKKIHNFSNLNNEELQIRTLLFGMIYLLFIKKVKAQPEDGNFVASIGARVKGLSENSNQFFWKTQKMSMEEYSDGSRVKEGFLVVLPILFKKDIDYTIDYTIDDTDSTINKKYISPIIIDIPNIAKSERIVELIGGKYKLEAGGIRLSWDPHGVAGLKCDDKFYIYDSNQKIAYDDWYRQDTTHNYIEKYKDNYRTQSEENDKRYMIDYAIYIKEDEPSFLTRIKNTMNTIKNTMNPWRKKGGRKKRKTVKRKINHPR